LDSTVKSRKGNEISSFVQDLEDKDKDVRSKAADALGEIGDSRAVEPLVKALKDKESCVRHRAADALRKIHDTRAIDPLIKALEDNDSYVRYRAAIVLGTFGDKRAVEFLIPMLRSPEEEDRKAAAYALGDIGDKKAVPFLIECLEDNTVRHNTLIVDHPRTCALWALSKIGDKRAVPALIKTLYVQSGGNTDNSDAFVIITGAIRALSEIGDEKASSHLIKCLSYSGFGFEYGRYNKGVRKVAQETLEKMGVAVPEKIEKRRIGVHLKSFPPTGDPYVDDCLTLQYQEVYDDRQFGDIPEMKEVASLGNAGRIDEAMNLAESLLPKYPDLDIVYGWLEFLHNKRGEYDKARAVLKDGLKKSKRKYTMLYYLGETELEARRLPEAVRWWIQSVLSQISIGEYINHNPFLYLAYVSQFFGLNQVALLLFQKVDVIPSGGTRLVRTAQLDLYKLVNSQGTESMRRALIELHNRYLSKKDSKLIR